VRLTEADLEHVYTSLVKSLYDYADRPYGFVDSWSLIGALSNRLSGEQAKTLIVKIINNLSVIGIDTQMTVNLRMSRYLLN
jgi:hypothetical protein